METDTEHYERLHTQIDQSLNRQYDHASCLHSSEDH